MDLSKIKLVATDCDGVLTDGGIYYLESYGEIKKFNVLDGIGFLALHEIGIKTAIITASDNEIIQRRGNKLKVDEIIMGESNKLSALYHLCNKYNITLENIAYIGDDYADIPSIQKCGFGCAPSGSLDEVIKEADYVTIRSGGNGCFREVANLILKEMCVNYPNL